MKAEDLNRRILGRFIENMVSSILNTRTENLYPLFDDRTYVIRVPKKKKKKKKDGTKQVKRTKRASNKS